MSPILMDAFQPRDRSRVRDVLHDLLRHVDGRLMIVGGAAIRYGLMQAGESLLERPFNDLDLMADGPEAFKATLAEDFLIHHFHKSGPETDFRFVLIHKDTNTKVDIFHWKPDWNAAVAVACSEEGQPLIVPVRTLASQLALTVFDLETMRQHGPVDPKQLEDALLMFEQIAFRSKPNKEAEQTWESLFEGNPPCTLVQSLNEASKRQGSEEEFAEKPWLIKPPYQCSKCTQDDPRFPIADMDEVYDRLGYVEKDGDNLLLAGNTR